MMALTVGCQGVYDPDLVPPDSGPDVVPPDSGCTPKTPEVRAGQDDGADVGLVQLVLRDPLFDQGKDNLWARIGYDVDGLCSDAPNPEVPCLPPDAASSPQIDGAFGVDNAFGHRFFDLVDLALPVSLEALAQSSQAKGFGNIVVRISGWNGEANDARVIVEGGISAFGTPGTGDGSPPDVTLVDGRPEQTPGSAALPYPAWTGDDYFWVRDEHFVEGMITLPRIRDDNAYVANGQLVARIPDRIRFVFPGDPIGLLMTLTDARLLVDLGETTVAKGTLTAPANATVFGRWPLNELQETAHIVGVCRGTESFDTLLSQLESIADVRENKSTDGAGLTCDAVSIAVGFKAFPGFLGGLTATDELPSLCASPSAP